MAKNGAAAKKVPLVLAMHGYTCSGEIYTGNSGWTKVADKYGFIVVHPTALLAHVNMPEQGLMPEYALFPAWNIFQEDDRPDELSFFNQMLDRTIDKYPVDKDCVFVMGDNRFNSHDGRAIGPVSKKDIKCKMLFFLWGKN